MRALDLAIFHSINGWPGSLAGAMRFFTEALNYGWMKILLILVLAAMIWAGKDTRKAALTSLIAFPIANGITDLFKHFAPSLRPCNDPEVGEIVLRISNSTSPGTASAHSANMLAVAICMLISLRWGGLPWLFLAILVALSRIYNAAHYPSQVLLGWICGAFAAVLVNVIWNLIEKRRNPKIPSDVNELNGQPAK